MTLGQRRCIQDEQITPGVILTYTLRADQRPRHPEKEWRGKVLRYDQVFHRAMVVSLEEGYEGCDEDVFLGQIVMIEKPIDIASGRAILLFAWNHLQWDGI